MSLRFLLAAALCVLISPSVLAQALVGGDAAAVLAAHNNERARVGVSGLVWDAKLAADAAGWARVLAPLDNLVHAQNTGQGENLAMGTKGAYTAVRLVDGWLDEKKDYVPGRPFPNVSRTGNEVVGHYTQMIWADTTSVGCAMSRSANNDILVCRYSPQGNFIGRFVMPHGTATAPPVIQPPQLAGQRPPPPAATNVAGVQKFEPATIFEHINFGGKSQALVEGLNVGPLAVGNDVTSSVKVSQCWKVTLYGAGPGQNGPELVLTADNANLTKNNFNDITSNVLVERDRDLSCDPNFDGLMGKWELDFPKNDWHYIEITGQTVGEGGPFFWNNRAGKRWVVSSGHIQAPNNGPKTYILSFGQASPYPGHELHLIRDSNGKLVFLKEYVKGSKQELQTWVIRR